MSLELAEVIVQDGESIEGALRRFKREVMKAGIIIEVKKRKHYESKRQRKKRKKEEAKRKAVQIATRKPGSTPNPKQQTKTQNQGFAN